MPVIFEFEVGKAFHFSAAFAERFGMPVANDRVYLPGDLGNGFIQEVYPGNDLALCIHHYELKQDFILKRCSSPSATMLTMKFDCGRSLAKPLFPDSRGCEVEFGTGNFFTELRLPANQAINFMVIGTSRQVLLDMVQPDADSYIAATIRDNESFVLHEGMTREMEHVLKQLSIIKEDTKLAALLYKTKAQELIYLLFTKLLLRGERNLLTISQADAEKIYEVRSAILADLSKTPSLPQLAGRVGISLTKMKELFRHIFGDSIYNYYQAARMAEAAELLNNLSVSETGYKVGFTNLSHFTRLFEKHHQVKPKRYKDTLEMV
jgi:AraC-like DNA-binding protein